MKKAKVLAGVLCLMMILSAMPVLQVSAEELTLDTIFADWGGYHVREWLDLSGTITDANYDEWITKENLVFTDANGAPATPVYDSGNSVLAGTQKGGTQFRWNNAPQYGGASWYPLADSAVVVTMMAYGGQANMQIAAGPNQVANINVQNQAVICRTADGWPSASIRGDWWKTIMILPVEGGYRLYFKGGQPDDLTDGAWFEPSDTVYTYTDGLPGVEVTAFEYLSSIRILEKPRVAYSDEQVMGEDDKCKKEALIEFNKDTEFSEDVIAIDETNGAVTFEATEGMKLAGGSATWKGAQYPISNSGGLYFKAKLGAGEELAVELGANLGGKNRRQARLYLSNQYAAAIGAGAWTASSFVPGHNWVEYYVTTNDQESGYCVYADKGNGWFLIQEVSGYINEDVYPSNVLISGKGSVESMYQIINFEDEKMIMKDYTGAILKADGTATIPATTSFFAKLAPSVTEGRLLFASYKGDNTTSALANVQIYNVEEIVNGEQVYAPVEGAVQVKVFLWSDFLRMNSVSNVKTLTVVTE